MNDGELIVKIHSSMYHQCKAKGYVAPVDVLVDTGILDKKQLEEWRFGRIPILELVCKVNLRKLSFLMHEMRVYAQKNSLKSSMTIYKRWGVKKKGGQGKTSVILLRFSNTGDLCLSIKNCSKRPSKSAAPLQHHRVVMGRARGRAGSGAVTAVKGKVEIFSAIRMPKKYYLTLTA